MPRKASWKLDGMSVPELLRLRDAVQSALSGKIETERRELQRQIEALSALAAAPAGGGSVRASRTGSAPRAAVRRTGRRGSGRTHPLKGRTVAPKYRDPDNPSQTWAGRGQPPRWLTAYENQGRKRDEFLIGASGEARAEGRKRR
jgi:DNA-binding protein H-NS